MNFGFDSSTRRELGYRLIDHIDRYFSSLPERPVQLPTDLRTFAALTDTMPEFGQDAGLVLDEVTAGRLAHVQVTLGSAVRIMTGGTLPEGADAVVMVEDVEEIDGRALLQRRPRPGENVHPPGMDLTRGQAVLCAGSRIGPAEVGLLATVGCASVPVFRRPRVAVLATGDELVDAVAELAARIA